MSLGSKINEIRKRKGLSIDELCELSGIPKGTLSKITAGITTSPTLDTVRAIANALECKLDDLDDSQSAKKSPSTAEAAPGEALHSVEDWKQAVDKMTKKQCRDAIILLLDKFMEDEE